MGNFIRDKAHFLDKIGQVKRRESLVKKNPYVEDEENDRDQRKTGRRVLVAKRDQYGSLFRREVDPRSGEEKRILTSADFFQLLFQLLPLRRPLAHILESFSHAVGFSVITAFLIRLEFRQGALV